MDKGEHEHVEEMVVSEQGIHEITSGVGAFPPEWFIGVGSDLTYADHPQMGEVVMLELSVIGADEEVQTSLPILYTWEAFEAVMDYHIMFRERVQRQRAEEGRE